MRVVVLLVVLLGGCAPRLQTAGNAEGGVTAYTSDQTVYFGRAEAHCRQYGRQAHVTNIAPYTSDSMGGVAFDCVKG